MNNSAPQPTTTDGLRANLSLLMANYQARWAPKKRGYRDYERLKAERFEVFQRNAKINFNDASAAIIVNSSAEEALDHWQRGIEESHTKYTEMAFTTCRFIAAVHGAAFSWIHPQQQQIARELILGSYSMLDGKSDDNQGHLVERTLDHFSFLRRAYQDVAASPRALLPAPSTSKNIRMNSGNLDRLGLRIKEAKKITGFYLRSRPHYVDHSIINRYDAARMFPQTLDALSEAGDTLKQSLFETASVSYYAASHLLHNAMVLDVLENRIPIEKMSRQARVLQAAANHEGRWLAHFAATQIQNSRTIGAAVAMVRPSLGGY